jgi:tripartite-type tricarboxylate transporter receptor subunit TctC
MVTYIAQWFFYRLLKLARVLAAGAAATALAVSCGHAFAQDYPSKPVRLIVPFPPGGGVDGVARLLASTLSESLNQQFVVDNRGGSGGLIAADLAVRSAPDGYTLFFGGSASHGITPNLYRKLPYDAVKDFTPIALVGSTPYVLVLTPDLPVKNVAGLIALAKAEPGKLNYGSAGNGSTLHLTAELFKTMAGVSIAHVPYKGAAQGLPDLLSGRISMAFLPLPIAQPFLKDGRLRALGLTSLKRSSLAPELPTLAEAGVPGFESLGWYGLLGPAGIPPAIVEQLNRRIQTLLKDQKLVRQLAALGIEPMESTPPQFARYIRGELDKWGEVVRTSGASVD